MTSFPKLDGLCGECDGDNDCTTGKCVLGLCSECEVDADCAAGLTCRYRDVFDARMRACVPPLSSRLPRGALCETDGDCESALRCAAADERAKRCGISCGRDEECGEHGRCSAVGVVHKRGSMLPGLHLLPSFRDVSGRITTCYVAPTTEGQLCTVHDQCGRACCGGHCSYLSIDWETGSCTDRASSPFSP